MSIAFASSHTDAARSLLAKIEAAILFPLITLLLSLALLLFLWGMFRFITGSGSEDERRTGKRHMLWGIIGILVMVSALAILRIAAGTFGLSVPN